MAFAAFAPTRLPKYPSRSHASRHVPFSLPSQSSDLRAVFTGGGSGGHVYPAIAIADDIISAHPTAKVLFVGTSDGMECNAVTSAGYDYRSVLEAKMTPSLISPENILLPFRLVRSVVDSWRILREFRAQIVVGTGGHVAAPVCLAAVIAGIKIVIQEQNAFPGLANRIIAPFAAKIFLAFNACVKHFPKEKCSVYGNPVRLSLRQHVSKAVARTHFFPNACTENGDEKIEVVLVLGGLGGSAAINMVVLNMYYDMLMEHKNRYIIWQTGEDGFSELESLVKNHRRLLLTPFLQAMDLAYAAADVVVSRAGAVTCTEILATGKPSILISSPNVADDHQLNNAYIMADVAGSMIITDDELDSQCLEDAVDEVLGNESLMSDMSERALRAARPNASADIARCVVSLVRSSSPT